MTAQKEKKMKNDKGTRLVRRFENAAINYSWLGNQDAEEHEGIRKEYKEARKALMNYIKMLKYGPPNTKKQK